MNVLVVDDAKISRMIISKSLMKLGFEEDDIIEAKNGLEAYNYLQDNHVDIIISDLSMPEMDGIELLTNLKIDGYDIMAIIISGTISENKRQKLNELNVEAIIKKPFTFKKIETILTELSSSTV